MEPSELDAWAAQAAAAVGVTLQPGDVAAVLDLARDAAHGVARPAAPLTAFVAGMAVGRGQPTAEAIAALVDAIGRYGAAGSPDASARDDAIGRRSAPDADSFDASARDDAIGRRSAPDTAPSDAATEDAS